MVTMKSMQTVFPLSLLVLPQITTALPANATSLTTRQRNPNSKRGISFEDQKQASAQKFTTESNAGWFYNWSSDPLDLNTGDKEFVPMLWTALPRWDQWHQDRWHQMVQSSSATHILGFNEPDQVRDNGGTALSVSDAVAAWRDTMNPLAGNVQLGSPGVSAAHISWMTDFLSACPDCHIDFFVAHYYGECNNLEGFGGYLDGFRESVIGDSGKPLWVTEFGPYNCKSNEQRRDWVYNAVRWLDAQDWIERYAYFGNVGGACGAENGSFEACDGTLTCEARAYLDPENDADGGALSDPQPYDQASC